jgi:hypothetical protein
MRSARMGVRAVLLAACVAAGAMCLFAGLAQAASYPSGGSTFSGGPESWQVADEPSCNIGALGTVGLCKAKGGYDAENGNPAGSLEAETEVVANLGGLFKATVGFESPKFKVGEGGSASLRLERQLASGNLLDLAPDATYQVMLLDRSSGTSTEVLSDTVSGGEGGFVGKAGAATVVAGHTYALAIATETSSSVAGIGLLGAAALRFDNVRLTVGSSGGGGGGGGGAGGGKAGVAPLSSKRLRKLILRSGIARSAVLEGNHLRLKLRCPAQAKRRKCHFTAQAQLRKGRAATVRRGAQIRKGKKRFVWLRVKRKMVGKVRHRKRLLIKIRVRAGKTKATAYKRVKLVKRR